MVKRKVAALEKVEADFVNLQYKIRRDPKSYAQEFYDQWLAYDAQKQIFLSAPSSASIDDVRKFHDLVDLIAHVADCYPDLTAPFPDDLKSLLAQHHAALDPELREKIVGSLALVRRKDIINSSDLLTNFFPILVSTPSKTLRALLYKKILSDLRESNSKSTNHRLNRTIQTVLHNIVTADRASPKALWAVKLTRELWKRQIWADSRPVDVMKEACLSDNEKVVCGAVRFFLGGDEERDELEDDSSEDEGVDLKKIKHQGGINKKTKKRDKAYKKAVEKVKRQERRKGQPHPLNFSALHLLHDPQGFSELLFQKHLQNTRSRLALENKLLVLQLVTRLVGLHKLTFASYSWFAKYLNPKQASVTSFLASLAQATHNLVPPEALEPLVAKIANEFVSEASGAEVASAGINAIREICARQPLAMSETLLQDLVQYRKSKDKGVMMAAKGLLSLYREVGAELLRKKDRGKDATISLRAGEFRQKRFGEEEAGGIEGLELLEKWKEEERERKRAEKAAGGGAKKKQKGDQDNDGDDDDVDDIDDKQKNSDDDDDDEDGFNSSDWEVGSTDSDDSGGWINVSDSEDEAPATKRQKTESEVPDLVDTSQGQDAESAAQTISKLATTTILTPADLAKLQELRMEASIDKAMGNRPNRQKTQSTAARHADDPLTAEQIELPAKLRKTTKEERIALAREGKPDREEHKSTQAIRKSKKDAEGKSTTNKEKARKKNFLMTIGKAKKKHKRSLVETRKTLRGHIERSKRGGRRGNGM